MNGIEADTLYGWRRQARRARGLGPAPVGHSERWSVAEKFTMVMAAAALNEAERGEYCRLGHGRGRRISSPDRQQAVALIEEARQAGARLQPACQSLTICVRTYQRWTRRRAIKTDGRPAAVYPPLANPR